MSKRFMATLQGGPFDGETVEIIGCRYERYVARDYFSPPRMWVKAVYEWGGTDDESIGIFKGLFDRQGHSLEGEDQ